MNQPDTGMFQFRALTEWDEKYNTWVSFCLETGSVVTADDPETCDSMLVELLEDESAYAIKHKNLANLFSSPAPFDKWEKWLIAKPLLMASIEGERGKFLGFLNVRRPAAPDSQPAKESAK